MLYITPKLLNYWDHSHKFPKSSMKALDLFLNLKANLSKSLIKILKQSNTYENGLSSKLMDFVLEFS